MPGIITNEDIYHLCQEILSTVKKYNEMEIQLLNKISHKLDMIYEGIKTLSDNQVVIDERIQQVLSQVNAVRKMVNQLMSLLPGR